MIASSFYTRLYLRSLTPFELLELSKQSDLQVVGSHSPEYMEVWIQSAVGKETTDELFDSYLTANKLSLEDVRLMMSKVEEAELEQIPSWVNMLQSISEDYTAVSDQIGQEENRPFYHILQPFLAYFKSTFLEQLGQSSLIDEETVIEQLAEKLYRELFQTGNPVFFQSFQDFKAIHRFQMNDDGQKDYYYQQFCRFTLSDNFRTLFGNYPLLARMLATTTERFLKFTLNMSAHLDADLGEIEKKFEIDIDKVKEINLGSGDLHNGEATAIFEFNNGHKVVYKPRNVQITDAYNQLISWVNENLNETLRFFKVIVKEDYGWLEFIDYKECETEQDVELFYERAGMLLGLGYFLNARDCHHENVIASGNCPILIDHETLVGPEIKVFNKQKIPADSEQALMGSVLETMLIPTGFAKYPAYIFGFGSSLPQNIQSTIEKIVDSNQDEMNKVYKTVSNSIYSSNKPRLNGQIAGLKDYQDQFKKGFSTVYQLVQAHSEFLLSDQSPIQLFRDVGIRFINRKSNIYYKILRILKQPQFLKDATKFGFKLELLARAYLKKESFSADHLLAF
ncbi:MAG: type 2 lanthipeptide synthetase LanM [Bacteroidota bacterium]